MPGSIPQGKHVELALGSAGRCCGKEHALRQLRGHTCSQQARKLQACQAVSALTSETAPWLHSCNSQRQLGRDLKCFCDCQRQHGQAFGLLSRLCLQPRTAQAYLHKQQAFNSLAHSVTDEDEGVPLDITLEPGIRLMQQTLRVGDMALILVVPADIDAVMDMYIDRGQEDRDPYWTRPWPSAVALAQEILERPELVRGKRVCELGAGLGVAAIAAAKAGAAEVVVLDREPLALQCALLSAVASGVPIKSPRDDQPEERSTRAAGWSSAAAANGNLESSEAASRSVSEAAATLSFGRIIDRQAAGLASEGGPARSANGGPSPGGSGRHLGSTNAPTGQSPRAAGAAAAAHARCELSAEWFDWSRPWQGAKYDVVLACDVLYEDFSVEPVAAAVPSMLKSSGTRLLLTDPAHRTEHNRKKFIELLRCGRDPFQVEEMASRDIEMDATTTDVQLMIFRRSLGGDTIGVKRL